jgi:hypothetical protein
MSTLLLLRASGARRRDTSNEQQQRRRVAALVCDDGPALLYCRRRRSHFFVPCASSSSSAPLPPPKTSTPPPSAAGDRVDEKDISAVRKVLSRFTNAQLSLGFAAWFRCLRQLRLVVQRRCVLGLQSRKLKLAHRTWMCFLVATKRENLVRLVLKRMLKRALYVAWLTWRTRNKLALLWRVLDRISRLFLSAKLWKAFERLKEIPPASSLAAEKIITLPLRPVAGHCNCVHRLRYFCLLSCFFTSALPPSPAPGSFKENPRHVCESQVGFSQSLLAIEAPLEPHGRTPIRSGRGADKDVPVTRDTFQADRAVSVAMSISRGAIFCAHTEQAQESIGISRWLGRCDICLHPIRIASLPPTPSPPATPSHQHSTKDYARGLCYQHEMADSADRKARAFF